MNYEKIDRSTKHGFKRYFSANPEHFRDIYGVEYTPSQADAAWEEAIYCIACAQVNIEPVPIGER